MALEELLNNMRRHLCRLTAYRKHEPLKFWVALILLFFIFYFSFFGFSLSFPTGSLVEIEEGLTLKEIAHSLKKQSVIRSETLFIGLVKLFAGDTEIRHGQYYFEDPADVFTVAWRTTRGIFGLEPQSVTIPEGASVEQMASILSEKFSEFDPYAFVRIAAGDEGYLFPDTHDFLPDVRAPQVHQEMRRVFEEKIEPLKGEIAASGHSLHEIITMASLLEKEAKTMRDRHLISGILWKRLEIGMPLQVDATFLYINGKSTFDLTLEDLRENESPYNTYKYVGLPPGPITNPGLASIKAALNPTQSSYLYYLSDLKSNVHYSRTFEEHKVKKARYLP